MRKKRCCEEKRIRDFCDQNNNYFLLDLNLSAEGIKLRDEMVFKYAFKYNVPILMLLSGLFLI